MLNELANEIHTISREKGFWPPDADCPNAKGHTCGSKACGYPGRNPGEVLMLIVTEAAEAMEAVRDNKWEETSSWHNGPHIEFPEGSSLVFEQGKAYLKYRAGEVFPLGRTELLAYGMMPKPEGVASELADVIIRVLDAAAAWGLDMDRAVRDKVRYNATRETLHGRAR